MTFLKQVTQFLRIFLIVGVAGLLYFMILGDSKISFGNANLIGTEFDEGTFTFVRLFLITLEFIWLTFWAFFYIRMASKATDPADETTAKRIESFEPKYFQAVAIFLVLLLILSYAIPYMAGPGLPQFHSHTDNEDYDQLIVVKANQFQFEFDVHGNGTFVTSTDKNNPSVVLRTNLMYLFKVMTNDTTHGFGLYSPDNVLLGQNQVVPGYENFYYYRFETPGVYKVLCMEYCGAGHHFMVSYISVV